MVAREAKPRATADVELRFFSRVHLPHSVSKTTTTLLSLFFFLLSFFVWFKWLVYSFSSCFSVFFFLSQISISIATGLALVNIFLWDFFFKKFVGS